MNLYEAVWARKSIRRYSMKPLSQDKLDLVMRFAHSLPMLFSDIEVEFKILDCTDESLRKKYFDKFQLFNVKAPYYLVIYSTKNNGYYINAGYLMQQISLYLTSKGIASCFLGAAKLSSNLASDPSMEHVITLAFGEGKSKIYRTLDKIRRYPEEDIVTYKENVSEDIRTILKAGRFAPSSMNNQPWRFVAYKNRIHVFCKKNLVNSNQLSRLKLIDIGVALGNMLVVTDEMWLYVDFLRLENLTKQYFKNYDYVITLKIISNFKNL